MSRQRLRAALAAHGAAPRKRHGQHFLLDDNLLAAIVRDSGVVAGQRVLEVGPGPGLLTRHLLAQATEVVAVEIDPLMERVAAELVEPELWRRLTWLRGDALAGSRSLGPELEQALPGVAALVANLPYAIAGPLLGALTVHPQGPARMVVMIQKEMGQRLMGAPGSRDYGPLAVLMALCARIEVLRKVPPGAFWPPPKVDSVLVAIERRTDRPCQDGLAALGRFLPLAFHNRRKTLWNSVMEACDGSGFPTVSTEILGDDAKKLRAEAIQPLKLYALAQSWAVSALGGRSRPGAGHRPHG